MLEMKKKPLGRFVKDGARYIKTIGTPEEAADAGYAYDPLVGLDLEKARKKKQIARKRWTVEFAGFALPPEQGGVFVRTDARNRTLLNAAALRAASDPSYEVENWKTAEGRFITLSNSMILTLNGAVEQFIAGCFAKEASLSAQIDSGTTTEEINAVAW